MHGGGNRIYGLHFIDNRLFAECGVLDNFRELCTTERRTRTCIVRGQTQGQELEVRGRA